MSDPTLEEDSLISQDDIDKLLDSSSIEEAEDKLSSNDSETDNSENVDDLGELSQDDIDSLLNSSTSSKEDPPKEDLMDDDDDMELISQDDIDNLVNASDEPSSSNEDADEDFEMISQDDISNLMSEQTQDAVVIEETVEPLAQNNSQEDDYVIDESEAVDVQESLITRETIDDLIKNFDNEPSPEPVVLLDEEENKEEENNDVAQEDIDVLLLEPDQDEDDILISQDDIDTLLMATDQDDEDILGTLMDDDSDVNLDDEALDIDILESNGSGEDENSNDDYDDGQVILEGDDDDQVEKSTEEKIKVTSQWYKSKLVIACASALIILGITVPLTYFIFFSGKPDKDAQQNITIQYAVETSGEIVVDTVDMPVKKQINIKSSGNMILKDFIILTPDLSSDMAYITADISIDYADQKVYHEIQNNLGFYRDLIYDSINNSFAMEKKVEITETDILGVVETTLKKVLPGHYISRVSFKSFKAS